MTEPEGTTTSSTAAAAAAAAAGTAMMMRAGAAASAVTESTGSSPTGASAPRLAGVNATGAEGRFGGAGSPVVVVLDNGAAEVKAGLWTGDMSPVAVVPNLVATRSGKGTLVGSAVNGHWHELSGYCVRRPFERGCLTSWDMQRDIWESTLRGLRVHAPECQLVVTEPPGTPLLMRSAMDALVFEELGFAGYWATLPQVLVAEHANRTSGSVLVVDCGFSATYAVPVIGGSPVTCASRRLNVGGKLMTNLLKETVSYRSWNMMDETFLMNHAKEQCCFVADNYMRRLDRDRALGQSALACEYILPDRTKGAVNQSNPFGRVRREDGGVSGCGDSGELKMDERQENRAAAATTTTTTGEQSLAQSLGQSLGQSQGSPVATQNVPLMGAESGPQVLKLTTERIAVPETLFSPQDIGLEQGGLASLVVDAVEATPVHLWEGLYSNVVVSGGSSQFAGLSERLERELRPVVGDHYRVCVSCAGDAVRGAVLGGQLLARRGIAQSNMVSKQEYEEHGHSGVLRRFMERWLVPE